MSVITPPISFDPKIVAVSGGGTANIVAVTPLNYDPLTGALFGTYASLTASGWLSNADQSIRGIKTFESAPETSGAITKPSQLCNKAYIDNLIEYSLRWVAPVISIIDVSTVNTGTAVDGDRYIASINSGLFVKDHIYIWDANLSSWVDDPPEPNTTLWVRGGDTFAGQAITFNGTTWIEIGSTMSHQNLIGAGTHPHSDIDIIVDDANANRVILLTNALPVTPNPSKVYMMADFVPDENAFCDEGDQNLEGDVNPVTQMVYGKVYQYDTLTETFIDKGYARYDDPEYATVDKGALVAHHVIAAISMFDSGSFNTLRARNLKAGFVELRGNDAALKFVDYNDPNITSFANQSSTGVLIFDQNAMESGRSYGFAFNRGVTINGADTRVDTKIVLDPDAINALETFKIYSSIAAAEYVSFGAYGGSLSIKAADASINCGMTFGTDRLITPGDTSLSLYANTLYQPLRIIAEQLGNAGFRVGTAASSHFTFYNTSDSLNKSSGSVQFLGGLGVTKSLYANLIDSTTSVTAGGYIFANSFVSGSQLRAVQTPGGSTGIVVLGNTGADGYNHIDAITGGVTFGTIAPAADYFTAYSGGIRLVNSAIAGNYNFCGASRTDYVNGAVTDQQLTLFSSANPAGTVQVPVKIAEPNPLQIANSAEATGLATGSLFTAGGAAVAKKLLVGGQVTFSDSTISTGVNAGALQITGGAYIGGKMTVKMAGGVGNTGDILYLHRNDGNRIGFFYSDDGAKLGLGCATLQISTLSGGTTATINQSGIVSYDNNANQTRWHNDAGVLRFSTAAGSVAIDSGSILAVRNATAASYNPTGSVYSGALDVTGGIIVRNTNSASYNTSTGELAGSIATRGSIAAAGSVVIGGGFYGSAQNRFICSVAYECIDVQNAGTLAVHNYIGTYQNSGALVLKTTVPSNTVFFETNIQAGGAYVTISPTPAAWSSAGTRAGSVVVGTAVGTEGGILVRSTYPASITYTAGAPSAAAGSIVAEGGLSSVLTTDAAIGATGSTITSITGSISTAGGIAAGKKVIGSHLLQTMVNNDCWDDAVTRMHSDNGTLTMTAVGDLFGFNLARGGGASFNFIVQLSHSWAEGTDVLLNMNYVPTVTGTLETATALALVIDINVFQTNGSAVPAKVTTTVNPTGTVTAGSGYQMDLLTISMVGFTRSAFIKGTITRTANSGYTGNLIILSTDIHYRIAGLGGAL